MKRMQKVTTLAVVGVLSLTAAGAGASAAAASTRVAPAPTDRLVRDGTRTPRGDHAMAGRFERTVSDGAFSITRVTEPSGGRERVVFYATDLRTGRVSRLNEAA
jgi:hypothetical protein